MSNFKLLKKSYEHKTAKGALEILVDGAQTGYIKNFYALIAQKLHFPSYFGGNLDALFDMLCDLSWLDDGIHKITIVLRHYDQFLEHETRNAKLDLLTVLDNAVEEWNGAQGDSAIQFDIQVEPNKNFKKDLAEALE